MSREKVSKTCALGAENQGRSGLRRLQKPQPLPRNGGIGGPSFSTRKAANREIGGFFVFNCLAQGRSSITCATNMASVLMPLGSKHSTSRVSFGALAVPLGYSWRAPQNVVPVP